MSDKRGGAWWTMERGSSYCVSPIFVLPFELCKQNRVCLRSRWFVRGGSFAVVRLRLSFAVVVRSASFAALHSQRFVRTASFAPLLLFRAHMHGRVCACMGVCGHATHPS